MKRLENTENDLQIDHQIIDDYVITLTREVKKVRTQYAANPFKIGIHDLLLQERGETIDHSEIILTPYKQSL